MTMENSSQAENTRSLQQSMDSGSLPAVHTTPRAMVSERGRYKPLRICSTNVIKMDLAHTCPTSAEIYPTRQQDTFPSRVVTQKEAENNSPRHHQDFS